MELSLLGRPRLMVNGQDLSFRIKYRKAWALLGYLACHLDQWCQRETLADLLWPQLDLAAARVNLRQVLNNLSSVLDATPDGFLQRHGDAIRLHRTSDLSLDLLWLGGDVLGRAGAHDAVACQWRQKELEPRLVQLTGTFLDGVQILQTPEFEDWLGALRAHWATRSALLLEQVGMQQAREKRWQEAIATYQTLLSLTPLDEGLVTRLMSWLVAAGQPGRARLLFEETRQRLFDEMDLGPSAVLQEAYNALALPAPTTASAVDPVVALLPELRWVTVLYVELRSQALNDEMQDESVRLVLQQWVDRWGGQRLDSATSGELIVFGLTGGGERAAWRAWWLAQDIVQAWGDSQCARVGLVAGKVLWRPGAAVQPLVGDVLDLVMRVAWTAEPGEIFLTDVVARQLGNMEPVVAVGARRFRGLMGEHTLFKKHPASERNHNAPYPVPTRRAALPLLGRESELRQLQHWWLTRGQLPAPIAVVSAPAGHGKTRLLHEVAQWVHDNGGQILSVSFRLESQHQPLAPFLHALDPMREQDPGGMQAKSVLYAALTERLEQRLAQAPTLILVDDMHWSDMASREFLTWCAGSLAKHQALLLMATRPAQALDLLVQVQQMDLAPLAQEAAQALAQACRGAQGLSASTQEHIVRQSGGVPLFIELLSAGSGDEVSLLPSIRDVLQNEVDHLGGGKGILRMAAVLGPAGALPALRALLPGQEIETVIDQAQALRLLERLPGECYAFRHALIHEVVYDSVPVALRKAMHQQVAQTLQSRGDAAVEVLAQHWSAAHQWQQAAQAWQDAGDAALEREFASDALACYQQALAALQAIPCQADGPRNSQTQAHAVKLRLGYAAHMAEGFGSSLAWQVFEQVAQETEANTLLDADRQAMYFAALSGCYMGGSSQGEIQGLNIARRLAELAQDASQQLTAAFALGNSLFWRGEFEEAAHWQRLGVELSLRLPAKERVRYAVDDPGIVCRAFLAWNLWFLGHDAQATAMAHETLAWADRQNASAHARCFGQTLLQGLYWCQGKHQELGELSAQTLALAQRYRFPLWEGVSGLFGLAAQARMGPLPDTTALFAAADQMQQAYQAGITTARWIAADALVEQGQWVQALPLLNRTIDEADSHEDQYCLPDLHWLKARCLAAQGEDAQAAAHRARASSLISQMGSVGFLVRQDLV